MLSISINVLLMDAQQWMCTTKMNMTLTHSNKWLYFVLLWVCPNIHNQHQCLQLTEKTNPNNKTTGEFLWAPLMACVGPAVSYPLGCGFRVQEKPQQAFPSSFPDIWILRKCRCYLFIYLFIMTVWFHREWFRPGIFAVLQAWAGSQTFVRSSFYKTREEKRTRLSLKVFSPRLLYFVILWFLQMR